MKSARLIICLIMLVTSASCMATAPARGHLAPVYNGPVNEEVLKGRIAFSGIEGLRAEIKAVVWKDSRRLGSFKGALVMRPPDDMRVVLYDAFGNTVMDIVRAEGNLEAYVPSKDAMYVGQAPSLLPPEGAEVTMDAMDGRPYELSATDEDGVLRRYEFDPRTAQNTRAYVFFGSGGRMDASFSDYLIDHRGNVPGSVVLRYGQEFRLELTIIDPQDGDVPRRLIPAGRTASRIYDISELETGSN